MSCDDKFPDLHAPEAYILKGIILPPTVVLLNGSLSFWFVNTHNLA